MKERMTELTERQKKMQEKKKETRTELVVTLAFLLIF